MKKSQSPTGRIIPHGVKPEPHELDTILFFTNLGKDIELIIPSNTPHTKRPDFFMDGLSWEVKSPTTNNHRTIERIFYQATQQSPNIIFDLRRIKGRDTRTKPALEKCFGHTRKARNMYIITKPGILQQYKK